MIRINQCKVSVPYTMQDVEKKVSQILHCKSEDIQKIHIVKESLDARKKAHAFLFIGFRCGLQGGRKAASKHEK